MVEQLKVEIGLEGASDIDDQLAIIRNGFASLGRVAVPVFAAITVAMVASTKATIAFAESMNKVSQAAIGVGQSFEQFVKLRQELEKLVPSSKDATSGLQAFQKSLEKIKAAEIAADLAETKKKLEGLGITVKQFPPDPFEAIRQSAQQAAAELPRFIQQLSQMPDSAERSAMAIERLGSVAGTSLIQSLKLADPNLSQTERSAILLTQAFDRLSTAWENFGSLTFAPLITEGINTATAALVAFQNIVTNFSWKTLSDGATAAFNLITGLISAFTLQGMITWIEQAILKWLGLADVARKAREAFQDPKGPLPEPGGIPQMAGGGLFGGRGTGTSDSNLAWLSRGEHIMPARVVRQPGVLAFLEALRRGGGIPGYAEGGAVGGTSSALIIGPVLGRLAKQLSDIANSIFQTMQPYMKSVEQALNSFWQTAQGMDRAMAGVQEGIRSVADELVAMENAIKVKGGNARGGLLGGRGTGTSDSNLAWVSRGEYITPARAVAQPGVLSFLEALRRSGGNLGRVLDGMGRFALGGMVPRYAAGGLAGGSNVTIQFPGLPPISGLRASSNVVEQLHRAAALAQVRSGGRKPSRYS